MRKAELIQAVHGVLEGEASFSEVADLVDAVVDEIKGTLARGEEVKITGFGVFQIRDKTSRIGRNPQTGETLVITPRRVVRFKTSAVLKGEMNRPNKEPSR